MMRVEQVRDSDPSRRPRRPTDLEAPGPGWRRSPSGVWLPPWQGVEIAQAGAAAALVQPRRPAASGGATLPSSALFSLAPSSATFGGVASGSPIASATDGTGNGHNLVQSTSARQPLYSATGITGGRPGMLCDGANDGLIFSSVWGPTGDAWIAIEHQLTSTSPAYQALLTLQQGSQLWILYACNGATYQSYAWKLNYSSTGGSAGIGGTSGAGLTTGRRRLLIVYYVGTGGMTARLDGADYSVVLGGGSFGAPAGYCGSIGSAYGATEPTSGYIGRVAVGSGIPTSGETAQIESWLDG